MWFGVVNRCWLLATTVLLFSGTKFELRFLVRNNKIAFSSICLAANSDGYSEKKYNKELYEYLERGKRQNFHVMTWRVKDSWINPSMTIHPDDPNTVLMVWRMGQLSKKDKVGFQLLDRTYWNITKKKDMIEIAVPGKWRTPLVGEDARIFSSNGILHVVYNVHHTKFKRIFFSELKYHPELDMLYVPSPPHHVIFENEVNLRHQKNWTPFDFCPTCVFVDGLVVPFNRHYNISERGQMALTGRYMNSKQAYEDNTGGSSIAANQPENIDNNGIVNSMGTSSDQNITGVASPRLLFVYSIQPHRIVDMYPIEDKSTFSVKANLQDRKLSISSDNTIHNSERTIDNIPLSHHFHRNQQHHSHHSHHRQRRAAEMNAETVFLTEMVDNPWTWGQLRGGTPALLVGDKYLSFFHSSGFHIHKHVATYVMGAYLFDRNPPFAITHISPEPILGDNFMNVSLSGWSYKTVDFIVFPMGVVLDKDYVYVSYGRNDAESWVAKLKRKELLDSLKPVKTRLLGTSKWHAASSTIYQGTYHAEDVLN